MKLQNADGSPVTNHFDTNNHWITSLTVVIVHPKDTSPESVAELLEERAADVADLVNGGNGAMTFSSVGTFIPIHDEAVMEGLDIPDWYDPARAHE